MPKPAERKMLTITQNQIFICFSKRVASELGEPTALYNVSREVALQRDRSALIEEDLHRRGERAASASVSRTASTCDRSTPGNQARNSSMDAPSLRFSKSAAIGTRVPRKTHAPPTRSGCRSTASQFSQVLITCPTLVSRRLTPEAGRLSANYRSVRDEFQFVFRPKLMIKTMTRRLRRWLQLVTK